jgi:hypothetical protein
VSRERSRRASTGSTGGVGIEAVGVRVQDEEGVDVPEREEELAHRIFEHGVAEPA